MLKLGSNMNAFKKTKLFKKAERQLNEILKNGTKAKKISLPTDKRREGITRQEGLDLIDGFKDKGMSKDWIKDTMLVMWKIENSKDLKRWHLSKIWDMLNSVKSDKEYRELLIDLDIG